MLDKNQFNDFVTYALIIGLFILAAIVIKPVITSMIFGILLAYIFFPIYKWTKKKLKNENLSAFVVCLGIFIVIIIVIILILTSLFQQAINFYLNLQKIDFTNLIHLFPTIANSEVSNVLIGALNTYIRDFTADFINSLTGILLNLPVIVLQMFVVVFIFFFSLRDGEKGIEYLKTLSPLKKETQEKFFTQFKDITNSVLIGQVVIGILQGIIAGIGYFVFGVPNALLLTLLTMLIGIIPIIGPWLVWIPVDIYLFATGRAGAGIGLLIYGSILINWIDTVIRPLIVSRRTQINSGIVLIGMIGGIFIFGVLGLIIGPLVLAYVLLVLELYRKGSSRNSNIVFIKG